MGGRAGIWDLAGTYWWLWVGDAQTKMPFLALAVCRAAPPNCHPFCCTPLRVPRACTGQGTGGLLWADGVQGHQAPRERRWGCPICTTALCAPDPLSRTCVLSASSCIRRSPAASQPTDNGVWGQEMRSTPYGQPGAALPAPPAHPTVPTALHVCTHACVSTGHRWARLGPRQQSAHGVQPSLPWSSQQKINHCTPGSAAAPFSWCGTAGANLWDRACDLWPTGGSCGQCSGKEGLGGAVNYLHYLHPWVSQPCCSLVSYSRATASQEGQGAAGGCMRGIPCTGSPQLHGRSRRRLSWALCQAGREPGRVGHDVMACKGSSVSCPAQPTMGRSC